MPHHNSFESRDDTPIPSNGAENGHVTNGVKNGTAKQASAPQEIDYARPMKVIVIGAGISGILASIRLPRRISNLDLVVYDKNPEVGGTWYENKYPGIACGKCILLS
jgi:heterodisulfide reductase subunit A-like polyferredoxin